MHPIALNCPVSFLLVGVFWFPRENMRRWFQIKFRYRMHGTAAVRIHLLYLGE